MRTAAIRQELLVGKDKDVELRRKIVALSALGLVDFALISLYQTGIIKKLPEFPAKIFDSNKVNAVTDAYQMGAPDGTISAWVYATTMVLATVGGSEASGRKPVHDALLAATVGANAAGAAYYLYNMTFHQKKICPYCIAGAVINFASAGYVLPVAIKAFKKLFGRQSVPQVCKID